jgi:hypothetical protein
MPFYLLIYENDIKMDPSDFFKQKSDIIVDYNLESLFFCGRYYQQTLQNNVFFFAKTKNRERRVSISVEDWLTQILNFTEC